MEWLKECRKTSGKTGLEVAHEAGITQQAYSLIEQGKRRPSVPVAKKIAAVLGFEWTKFYDEEAA